MLNDKQLGVQLLIAAVVVVVFAFDALVPLGVAGGIPYVLAVSLARVSRNRNTLILTVCGTILLTLFGTLLSPDSALVVSWIYVTNRVLAILAILVVAGSSWWYPETVSDEDPVFPRLSFLTPLLTILVVVGAYWLFGMQMISVREHADRTESIIVLRGDIVRLDEVLTMSARMAAVTGSDQWVTRYHEFEPQLDDALERLKLLADKRELVASQETIDANVRLVQIESTAFELIRDGDSKSALEMLSSDLYRSQQQIFSVGMLGLLDALHASNARQFADQSRQALYQFAAAFVATLLCLAIWVATLRTMVRWRLSEEQSRLQSEQAHRRLDFALTGANIGLWDWNAETDEVEFSPTLKNQLGYPPDAHWRTFNDWESRVHQDDHDEAMSIVEDYMAGRRDHYRSTFRMRCADQTYRWILSLGQTDFDSLGAPSRMIGVHVDITERIQHEQELSQLNVALTESNDELEQFAYVASHDLQEPLRKVSSFCELLEREYGEQITGDGKLYLSYIMDGSVRMRKLIQDLLEFSRLQTTDVTFCETDSQHSFDVAIENLDQSIDDSNAIVTHDDLPVVHADQLHLTQLFQNLVGNAIKYRSGEKPAVHVAVESTDEHWRFSVADNGIGIESRFQQNIFGVFTRLHARSEYPGTGIGLAICQRIVNQLGGKIWVESESGSGSIFHFTVPK